MIIPVIIGAIALGGAFDYFDLQPKSIYQIFDYNAVKNNLVDKDFQNSDGKYKVVESADEAFRVLRIDPAMTLKSMQGVAAINGFSRYINKAINRRKIVEILISYEIVKSIRTFPTTIKQGKGWQNKPQQLVGTHYVDAIQYGGHLVISIQFKPIKPEYVEEVRSIVNSKIGKEGSLDTDFFGHLEKLSNVLSDKASLELYFFSTVGSLSVPTSLRDISRMVREFPGTVERVNGGKGAPLKISLADLHSVQPNFTEFKVSRDVEKILDTIEAYKDDVRIAKREYRAWESQGSILPPAHEEKMNNYLRRLKLADRAIAKAIAHLDITGSTSQFDDAIKAYDYDGGKVSYRYTKELEELIKIIDGNSHYRSVYSSLLAIQEESRSY